MAARRYYYSDYITDFLSRSNNEIVGALTLASQHDVNDETSKSWVEEIETMREVLAPYEGRGSVYFEYIQVSQVPNLPVLIDKFQRND